MKNPSLGNLFLCHLIYNAKLSLSIDGDVTIYFNLPDFNTDLLGSTATVKNFVGLIKQEYITY